MAGRAARLFAHALFVGFERSLGLVVDHRTDIGGVIEWIADSELAHGAEQHLQDRLGNVGLEIQHAERRAALPGAIEGGSERIVDHLPGQSR